MKRRPAVSPRPKAVRVPARFRAVAGVDPRQLPPGTAYPCDDPRVGRRGVGKRAAGTILACATPPEGKRGRFYAVGEVEAGAALSRSERERERTREALRDRYDGPEFDARPQARPKVPRAPREKAHSGEVVNLHAVDPAAFDPRRRGAPANDFEGLRRAVATDVRRVMPALPASTTRALALVPKPQQPPTPPPSRGDTPKPKPRLSLVFFWYGQLPIRHKVTEADFRSPVFVSLDDAEVVLSVEVLGAIPWDALIEQQRMRDPAVLEERVRESVRGAMARAQNEGIAPDAIFPFELTLSPRLPPVRVVGYWRANELVLALDAVKAAPKAGPRESMRRAVERDDLVDPTPAAVHGGGEGSAALRDVATRFLGRGALSQSDLAVLAVVEGALYRRVGSTGYSRTQIDADLSATRSRDIIARQKTRAAAAARAKHEARSLDEKIAASEQADLMVKVGNRLLIAAGAAPYGTFPGEAIPAQVRVASPSPARIVRREEMPGPAWTPRPKAKPRVPEMDGPAWAPRAFEKDPAPTAAAAPVGESLEIAADPSDTRWSKYQRNIFVFIANGTGNAVIEAVAGSGKSTTIVEAVRRIPQSKRVLILAFNVSIKDELKEKFRGFPNVEVRTLNGHAYRAMAQGWAPISLPHGDERASKYQDDARFKQILNAARVPPPVKFWKNLTDSEKARFGREGFDETRWRREVEPWGRDYDKLKQLIELCRGFLALTPAAIEAVQGEYDLLLQRVKRKTYNSEASSTPWTWFDPRTKTHYDRRSVVEWVQAALHASLERPRDGRVARFDAVFPTAMLDDLTPERFDWLFVDETQDMDTAQLAVVQKSIAPGGRVVVVGDGKQAIYRFRGADVTAMSRMETALAASRLPLSVSYRVPQCSARLAQRVVPAFEVPEGTPEGTCDKVSARMMVRSWKDGDFVISRTNAPLVPLAMLAIQQGHDVVALGLGDISRELKNIARGADKIAPGWRTPEEFKKAVEEHQKRAREFLFDKERRTRARYSRGRARTDAEMEDIPAVKTLDLGTAALLALAGRAKTAAEIDAQIERIVQGRGRDADVPASALKGKLVFTTVHKIKGAESPRVWMLDETFGFRGEMTPSGGPVVKNGESMSAAARQEEMNLWYVAITRVQNLRGGAAGELHFVSQLEAVLGEGYVDEDEAPRENPRPARAR